MLYTFPRKRQKRSEYRRTQQQQIESGAVPLPQKRLYRQRAHANPFSDHRLSYPISPAHMDWSTHFPAYIDPNPENVNLSGGRLLTKDVEIADIGCGFGGLLVALAPLLPDTLMVGMELRAQVLEYVTDRIRALRAQRSASPLPTPDTSSTPPAKALAESSQMAASASFPSQSQEQSHSPAPPALSCASATYQNISAIRSNTMKFLPNFFAHHQLSSIFICFPDPHFKTRKHKARIVSVSLNAEYAYVLRPGGKLYTITDVEELHRWIVNHFEGVDGGGDREEKADEEAGDGGANTVKELFERVGDEELEQDPCVKVMMEETEEGKKVTRNKGHKYVAVWRRKEDPQWPC
ncbi:tRNA (guanine-N(7)-)-methyltransferase [Paracoccidioides lutzii Pb01]|uniref:tRNA (guanine-N(7)-)-methyltransferase n=1 Tax=Paracoccidioides lutzii (strain ATCC MYA-826 / Pb01) TaxID=502779 RepID=C1GYF5_PARBA|nr:tRNA (guanine-N(7)-)-methyltransferase [Paracoccidioides lutzii Pb01]EEH41546.2 tRNA (guanine-N(7)-)-methyltransferase [Paracoccidioides lutzii Pb01]